MTEARFARLFQWGFLRAAQLILTVLIASFLVYGSVFLIPGDPISTIAGGEPLTAEQIAALRQQFGLDGNFLAQYVNWLGGTLTGEFGTSLTYRQPVGELIASRFGTTAMLSLFAAVLVVGTGLVLGSLAGMKGGMIRRIVTFVATVGGASPAFVTSMLLILVFAVWFPVFPSGGQGQGFFNQLHHLVLPAVALATVYMATIIRVTDKSVLKSRNSDHVQMATSRGLPPWLVFRRHILWNAVGPVLTVSGIVVAGLLTGTAVTETVFGLQGLGSLLVSSVQTKDFAVVQAIALILVVAYGVTNAVVDVMYAAIDPRVRR